MRVLRCGKGALVEWMVMVESAEEEARKRPEGEKRMQVMPREWGCRVPLGTGLKDRRLEEEGGGGVGVDVGGGWTEGESKLEERERGVSVLLEVESLLLRRPRERELVCHDLRRVLLSWPSLSLSLAELERFLLRNGCLGLEDGLSVD